MKEKLKESLWKETKMRLIAGLVVLPMITSTIGYIKTDKFINDANSQDGKKIRAEMIMESFQDRSTLSKPYFTGDYLASKKYLNNN